MKICVTGGAGYIGSILVSALLDKGYKVIVLENFMYHQNSLLNECWRDTLEIVRGDCRDEETLRPLVAEADVIIPLAAIVGMPACETDKTAAVTTNLHAVSLLCSLASKSQRILFPTTNSGYGIGGEKACTEESPLNPVSVYGVTKVQAEKIVLDRENSIAFRLATVFGVSARMRTDLLLNDFVHRAVMDGFVALFEGHFRRNYIHVRDVARVFIYGIENFETMRGKPYNVGLEDANLTKRELCERIKRHVPGFYFYEAALREDIDKRDYLVSNNRILATGWRPKYSLDDGIKELIKGYEILKGERFGNV